MERAVCRRARAFGKREGTGSNPVLPTMDFSNISSELREKAAGLPADELIELAKNEGVELTDEQLNAIAGGSV